MHQTLKQRYEGPSIKDARKSGGGSGVLRGAIGAVSFRGRGGAKFQLFLGCRKSHKGKIHVSKKKSPKIFVWLRQKESQLRVLNGGGKFKIRPGRQIP